MQSIRYISPSNPIRVQPSRNGRYKPIQAWRRLTAYHQLLTDTVVRKGWTALTRDLPRGVMRSNSSIAAFLIDPLDAEHDPDSVMAILIKLSGYQKRRYTRTFIRMV